MRRPTVATIFFGSLVVLGFVVLATVLMPLSSATWSIWGADGLFYHYLTEFF